MPRRVGRDHSGSGQRMIGAREPSLPRTQLIPAVRRGLPATGASPSANACRTKRVCRARPTFRLPGPLSLSSSLTAHGGRSSLTQIPLFASSAHLQAAGGGLGGARRLRPPLSYLHCQELRRRPGGHRDLVGRPLRAARCAGGDRRAVPAAAGLHRPHPTWSRSHAYKHPGLTGPARTATPQIGLFDAVESFDGDDAGGKAGAG